MKYIIVAVATLGILASNTGCLTKDRANSLKKEKTTDEGSLSPAQAQAQAEAAKDLNKAKEVEAAKNEIKTAMAMDGLTPAVEQKAVRLQCTATAGLNAVGEKTEIVEAFKEDLVKDLKIPGNNKYFVRVNTSKIDKKSPAGTLQLSIRTKAGEVIAQGFVNLNTNLHLRSTLLTGNSTKVRSDVTCDYVAEKKSDVCSVSTDSLKKAGKSLEDVSLVDKENPEVKSVDSDVTKVEIRKQPKVLELYTRESTSQLSSSFSYDLRSTEARTGNITTAQIVLSINDGANSLGVGCGAAVK